MSSAAIFVCSFKGLLEEHVNKKLEYVFQW